MDNGDEDEDRPVDNHADVSCNNVHSNRRNNSPETLVKLLPKMFGGTSRPLRAAAGPTRWRDPLNNEAKKGVSPSKRLILAVDLPAPLLRAKFLLVKFLSCAYRRPFHSGPPTLHQEARR